MSQILFQIQSTLIVLLMTYGIWIRRNRNLHPKVMSTAMIWDVLLILQIEITRGAINKAIDVPAHTQILTIHVCFAISTVISYGFVVWSGRKLLKSGRPSNKIHKNCGIVTYVLRLLTYGTSFFTVAREVALA